MSTLQLALPVLLMGLSTQAIVHHESFSDNDTADAASRKCLPPSERVDCAGTPGGKAGCLARGCCYDSTQPGHTDWCSHYDPAPPPPPPSPPTRVVWQAGRGGELIKVHAGGGSTLWLGDKQWVAERPPSTCGATYSGFVTVGGGVASNGTDPRLGAFEQFEHSVSGPAALRGTVLTTRFWSALEGSSAFEFSVRLQRQLETGGGGCRGGPLVGWPFGGAMQQEAAWLTYRGDAPGEDGMARHKYGASVRDDTGTGDTAPLALIGKGGAVALIAPSNEFLTTQVALAGANLVVGPQPNLASLPASYTYSVSATLSADRGATATFVDWGSMLQRKYANATSVPAKTMPQANPLNQQLSYSTALGEWFDYLAWKTEGPPVGLEHTPQQALLNVSAYFRANNLPIKLFMLDIWWVNNDYRGAPWRHCMYDWQPITSYFPKGLAWLANATGAGMMPYANYLCENSTYATSGDWNMMDGNPGAHGNVYPNESKAFWTQRFTDAKKNFGMSAFWNDHMSENMDEYRETTTVPGEMRRWMKGQADAALASGTPIMYCMEKASQMVQSVEFPAVTTGRASSDYHPPSGNWFLGPESLLLGVLGKAASKDGINSGVAPNHEGVRETNPLLHVLTAVLTKGPVTIGDRPGFTNFSLLKPCCSSGSDILSPSHALKPIDATYQPDSPVNGLLKTFGAAQALWTAHSSVGHASAHTVLAVALPQPYGLSPAELWPLPKSDDLLWAFEWGARGCTDGSPAAGCLRAMSASAPLLLATPAGKPGTHSLQHFVVTKQTCGWVVLGELTKYVTLSPRRFTSIVITSATLAVTVRGAVGEGVTLLFKKPGAATLSEVTLRVGADGTATAEINA